MTRSMVIGYHGHCFDGMCSAAVLTRVLRVIEGDELSIAYRGLEHRPGGSFVPDEILSGDVNAVVDYRYTMNERLVWWFDHHESGLVGDAEREHFARDQSGRKVFDPSYGSCCKLIADVAAQRLGVALPELAGTIAWADMIDAARFPDARTAVELAAPALQLMTVIEAFGDDRFLAPRIDALAQGASLDDVATDATVQKVYAPLRDQHQKTLEAIRAGARCERGVVSFDLIGGGSSDRYNKFIPYYLFPEARYAVAVSASKARAKVSVGSNPWCGTRPTHNIAEICARYGGGGHRYVGAVSLPASEVPRARAIAQEITAVLEKDPLAHDRQHVNAPDNAERSAKRGATRGGTPTPSA
jgi:hypothetical protein